MRLNSDQALGLQVLRRTHHVSSCRASASAWSGPTAAARSNVIDAVRWVLGESKGQRAARRVDAGRDLQRLGPAQAGQPRQRRAGVRQRTTRAGGQWNQLCRDRRQARADARRHVRATTSTTSRCGGATCRTSSSAPAWVRAPTRSSARARSAASSRASPRSCGCSSKRPRASRSTRSAAARPKAGSRTRAKT